MLHIIETSKLHKSNTFQDETKEERQCKINYMSGKSYISVIIQYICTGYEKLPIEKFSSHGNGHKYS